MGRFEPDEDSPSGWVVQADLESAMPARQLSAMQAIAERRLPEGSDPSRVSVEDLDLWLRGEIPSLASTVLDAELSQWLFDLRDDLQGQARRCYELVRWVTNARSSHQPFRRGLFEFSLDGQSWHRSPAEPLGKPFDLRADSGIQLGSLPWDGLSWLASEGHAEPVGHSLIREASSLRREAPRAAVVLGAAAAETALKGAISVLAPEAAFLVDKLQSPSPHVLLKEYLPTLRSRASAPGLLLPAPRALRKSIHWLSETRNRVVHNRNQLIHFPELPQALIHVRDLVWLMDYHCGHEWAAEYISQDLLRTPA